MSAPKRDWKKIIEESNGQLMMVPEALLPKVKNWLEKKAEFSKEVNRIAKMENEVSNVFNNLVFDVRTYLAENGRENVWTSDLGFETAALQDGLYVLSVRENTK